VRLAGFAGCVGCSMFEVGVLREGSLICTSLPGDEVVVLSWDLGVKTDGRTIYMRASVAMGTWAFVGLRIIRGPSVFDGCSTASPSLAMWCRWLSCEGNHVSAYQKAIQPPFCALYPSFSIQFLRRNISNTHGASRDLPLCVKTHLCQVAVPNPCCSKLW
jgi:hypothetical protein